MSRLFILGTAPLPHENQARRYAANLRTWQVTKPLVDRGHTVRLVGCRLPKAYFESADLPAVTTDSVDGWEYFSVAAERFEDAAYLRELVSEFDPDAIIGVTTHASSRAVQLDSDLPIWCDLHGWIMAEAQSKASVYDDDRYLSHFWRMEKAVLERADVLSTVSEAQSHAVVGELAVLGRLSRKTFGYRFCYPMPTATHEVEYETRDPVIRGPVVESDAFVVLWVGGYNTWTDVDLLFEALQRAMREVPEIHYVSTGGAIEGHDDITFARFQKRVANSDLRNRFHFMGWVTTEAIPSFYAESNLGINIDSQSYEGVFGARTRLNEMMHCGLPVLTTLETEISRQIADLKLGLSCATADSIAFAEKLAWAAAHGGHLQEMAQRAKKFVDEELSYAKTTRPLLEWVENPRRSPDLAVRIEFQDIDYFRVNPSQGKVGDSVGKVGDSVWSRFFRWFSLSRGR